VLVAPLPRVSDSVIYAAVIADLIALVLAGAAVGAGALAGHRLRF
jgi:hypothetical protein